MVPHTTKSYTELELKMNVNIQLEFEMAQSLDILISYKVCG